MSKLCECVPNFSEGRRPEVLDAICSAMTSVSGVWLLDREMDAAHNRAVVTLAGEPEPLTEAVRAGAGVALQLIDLNEHEGEHPRMGAMDVCPFIPLGKTPMEVAVAAARNTADRLGNELDLPIFLYEEAAERPDRKNLAKVRRGQFEKLSQLIGTDPEREPDRGPGRIHPTGGATAVGARFFLVAYNVNLDSKDVELAKAIGKKVRERDGGLPKVKAMGFFLDDRELAQVSMNLTDYRVTGIRRVYDEIAKEAAAAGVLPLESELVGLVPREAIDEATASHVKLVGFDAQQQCVEERLAAARG